MIVVAKDDCFTPIVVSVMQRRGVPAILAAREEKVHSQVLVDALDGLVPDAEVLAQVVTKPYAVPFHLERSTLSARGADLIIIGSFSDVTIRLWRHREGGWRFFERAEGLPPKEQMAEAFEREDFIHPERSMANTLRLFDHYRRRSPGAACIWVNYPFVSGDTLVWQIPDTRARDPQRERLMELRSERFTALSHSMRRPCGVFVVDIPRGFARSRDGVLPWHYQDEVYIYATNRILEHVGSRRRAG